jgi:hypothetical protein
MKIIIVISFFILFDSFAFPQDKRKDFIEALINNAENTEQFVDKDELEKSKRLGINYDSIKNKFLISYGVDEKIKYEIKTNAVKYEIKTAELDNGYSISEFSVPSLNYSKQFYFKNGKWVSPVTYYSKDWATKTSKYFIFKISEPKYFNDYCINKLDEFVDSIAVLLEFTEQEKKLLEEEKIYYVLCRDEKEIERVTGFNTRGIYITAFDEVVTTYNTHYHELAHLLINYKLKTLSLYTLPFFQEGFAVAVGGRGGMAKRVVLDIGYYLHNSGFLTYDSIITNEGFYKEDASLTYPVAGFYNAFLLKEMGTGAYVELYKKVNGDLNFIQLLKADNLILPGGTFVNFLDNYGMYSTVYVNAGDTNKPRLLLPDGTEVIMRGSPGDFMKVNSYYKFIVNSPFLFSPEDKDLYKDYISKKNKDVLDDEDKIGNWPPKYGIVCDSLSIRLYNFYTNEVIASYSTGFSIDQNFVPFSNDNYSFFINESVFENDLDSTFSIIGNGR